MGAMKRRMLIVDDEPHILALVSYRLQAFGFEVSMAMDGQEALVKVFQDPPDLIILDVMMPLMNGFEVCARLKRDDRTRRIPIVLFTAKAQDKDYAEGMACGADAYLTKPFDAKDLHQIITHLSSALSSDRSAEPTGDHA